MYYRFYKTGKREYKCFLVIKHNKAARVVKVGDHVTVNSYPFATSGIIVNIHDNHQIGKIHLFILGKKGFLDTLDKINVVGLYDAVIYRNDFVMIHHSL